MKHSILVALLFCSAVVAQERWTAPVGVPDLATTVSIVPLKLPPDMYMGEAAGVSTNSRGHIFVFTRTGHDSGPARGAKAARLWEFDANGKFVREIGKNLYGFSFAHGVRVDKDDNIWAVDEGSNMVIKFNPDAQVTLVLGRKHEAVDYLEHYLEREHPAEGARLGSTVREGGSPNSFDRPTDVTWDAAGNIYVSDGYNNARVAKFDRDGNWIKGWGTKGKEIGQFDTVHGIASDTSGRVYVGDRSNRRVQVFDGDGKFITQFPGVGGGAVCIPPGPNPNRVLFVAGNSFTGILKMNLDGKILGIVTRPGRSEKNALPHALACPTERELYVGETGTWRVKKITILK